jgi:hypothetical protein
MRIFVLKATYELRVSRKSHLRDHPISDLCLSDWRSLETVFLLKNMLNHSAPATSTAGTSQVKRLHIDLHTKVCRGHTQRIY